MSRRPGPARLPSWAIVVLAAVLPVAGVAAGVGSLRDAARAAGALAGGRIRAAHVLVIKSSHQLVVLSADVPLRTYRIELGRDASLPKDRRGDGRTPEGDYYVCEFRGGGPYHRGLLLAYPNAADASRGLGEGLIDATTARAIREAVAARRCPPQDTALGGLIMIHGQHPQETAYWEQAALARGGPGAVGLEAGDRDPQDGGQRSDWTLGCVGMRNQDVRELFDLLPPATPVTIVRGP